MRLSILICSLQSRSHLLKELVNHLEAQGGDVEILTNVDNKEKTTGKKRQELLLQAKGDYIVFIDDDDWVPDYYVEKFLKALEENPDCVSICGTMTTNGANEIPWRLSKNFQNITTRYKGRPMYLRKTNHITAVKRLLALRAGFPDKSNAEDKYYSERVARLCKKESVIEEPMYHYRYSSLQKEYA